MAQNEMKVGWVSGMPRSGTTWLSQILASSPDVRLKFCPLFAYEFKNALDENSTADDWRKLFADVYQTKSEYLDQDYLRKGNLVPTFHEKRGNPRHLVIKSTRFHNLIPHILRLDNHIRFIHLVRHPCATIHSWLTNPYEFPEDADPLKEWRSGECRKNGPGEFWGFDDWKTVSTQALRLAERYPTRFRIVRYETLVRDARKCVNELFAYLEIPYEKQTNDFVELSQSKHDENKRSVYKSQKFKSDWFATLDSSIVSECLSELAGTELQQFLEPV
jgi:hypothetical protein